RCYRDWSSDVCSSDLLEVEAIEEVWHGLRPPFAELFAWAEGRAGQPLVRDLPVFRPFMLAHPLDDLQLSLADFAAEWKWDGIREIGRASCRERGEVRG